MKICFVGSLSHTFVKRDYEILKKHFDVDVVEPPKTKFGWIKYISFIKRKVKNSDITFCWFAGWHSAPAIYYSRKYKKKSIVVVGGYDAAYVPEINYGAFTNIKERIPAKYVLKNVDKSLVVDASLKQDIIKNAGVKGDNIEYLPTGYDPGYWKPNKRKERIVLTVGKVSWSVVKRKGFETFVRSAKYVPDAKFVLVGKHADNSIDYLKKIASSNVEFTGFVSDETLLEWYKRAKCYCQLSIYEGLPNALCEAMLCECIPVGTKCCGIPVAIGDCGFYVPYGDEKATAEAIKKALNAPDELGKKARERIKKMFPHTQREERLLEVIEVKRS